MCKKQWINKIKRVHDHCFSTIDNSQCCFSSRSFKLVLYCETLLNLVKRTLSSFCVLWCSEQSNSSFSSESSSLFTCKISRLGNYQNLSYTLFKKLLKMGDNFVKLLFMIWWHGINYLYKITSESASWWIKQQEILHIAIINAKFQ